jgi:hypothetical protein
MPFPVPKVEIAFDASPYAVSPVWTDVTSSVRALSTDRGRSDDWDDFYGSAQVVLNNRTRLFDPFFTSGIYYGKLLPRKQIRITARAFDQRTNFITNPSFETNNTGWNSGQSGGMPRSTTFAFSGIASGLTTMSSSVDSNVGFVIPTFTGAGAVTFSIYVYTPVGSTLAGRTVSVAREGGTATVTLVSSSPAVLVAGSWTRLSVTHNMTVAGTIIYVCRLSGVLSTAVGQLLYFDAALAEFASTAGTYFDGSTVGYAWNGTPNASTSSTFFYPVFRGFISGWSPQWTDAGTDSTVTLSCFDALQLLGSEQLPADWSRQYILGTLPRHYYPCDEPITPYSSGILTDYGSAPLPMTVTGAASSGSQLAVGLVNSSVTGTGSNAANSALGLVNSSPGSFTVSCWAIADASTSGSSQFVTGNIYNHSFYFGYSNTTGKYFVEVSEPSFANTRIASTDISGWDAGMARMMSFTWDSPTRTITIYMNGLLVASTTINSAGIVVPLNESVNIGTGSVQQVIVYDAVASQSMLQDIFRFSTVALFESTTARANRIIGETPFSASLCSFPLAPAVSVLDITDDAPFAAPELRRVAASECAPLFVSNSGVVTMYQQQQQFTQSRSINSQITYGAGGTDMGQVFELMPDGDSLRNEVNVTMSQGGVYTQRNTASITAYGASSQSVDSQVQSLADAKEVANITTGWGGQVYPRLSPVDVVLDSVNDWAPTMGLELMDRITINAQPPSGGNPITVPMLVQNIKHSAVPGEWRTTLEGSARWAAVFIINKSLIGGTDLLG